MTPMSMAPGDEPILVHPSQVTNMAARGYRLHSEWPAAAPPEAEASEATAPTGAPEQPAPARRRNKRESKP